MNDKAKILLTENKNFLIALSALQINVDEMDSWVDYWGCLLSSMIYFKNI